MKNFSAEQALFESADYAGRVAASAARPTPMIVGTPTTLFGNTVDWKQPVSYVAGGVCGFAWVSIRPARGRFVAYLKSRKIGGVDHYAGGYSVSSRLMVQSMALNEAYAEAFAGVLRAANIEASAHSRID